MQPVQPASAGGLWPHSILEISTSLVLYPDPQDPERRRLGGRTLSIFLNEGQGLQLPLPLAPLLGGCVSKPREFVKTLGNLPHDQSLFSLGQLQHSHIPPTTACKTKLCGQDSGRCRAGPGPFLSPHRPWAGRAVPGLDYPGPTEVQERAAKVPWPALHNFLRWANLARLVSPAPSSLLLETSPAFQSQAAARGI